MPSVPLLRLNNEFNSYISGEVIIHPSAVIASGVILQASANSKIIISSGVCIGMGSILQVSEGTIEIEAGVNLGAGVLMVGAGKIGANSCIGAATTIFNSSIPAEEVIPSGSIFGDTSRKVIEESPKLAVVPEQQSPTPELNEKSTAREVPGVTSEKTVVFGAFVEFHQQPSSPSPSVSPPQNEVIPVETVGTVETEDPWSNSPEPNQQSEASGSSFGAHIYGQGSIQRLLVTLFPHRQPLTEPNSDQSSH